MACVVGGDLFKRIPAFTKALEETNCDKDVTKTTMTVMKAFFDPTIVDILVND